MDRNARPILEIAPTQWARFVLRMSPAAGSIDEKEALRLASLALHAGRTASIKIPFGATPYDFADDLGILIFFNQDLRPEIRFAECHTLRGKTTITVFEEHLHRIQHAITEAASLGVEIDLDPLELILWHELFHGMEMHCQHFTRLHSASYSFICFTSRYSYPFVLHQEKSKIVVNLLSPQDICCQTFRR